MFIAVGTLLVGSGIAAAMWSASGVGTAQAKALNAQTLTVTAATATADLYPGFAGGDVFFTIANTNPYPVTFTSMTPGTVTSSNPGSCSASNVTVASGSGLSLTVGANTTSAVLSIADVASMASTAPDGCQGVSFSVALTLAGSQI